MDVSGLNPVRLGSLWIKTSASYERQEVILAEDLNAWREGEPGLFNYILAFALQLRKSTEHLSESSRAATGLLVAPTWLYLRDSLSWPAGRQFTSLTLGTSVSPRPAQVPYKLPD
jgi:hypothetical protein